MGYRSDVVLGIAFPNTEALVSFVSAQRITGDRHMQEALKEYVVTRMCAAWKEGVVMWASFEQVKWYPDYPDVQAHEQILANARLLEYSTLQTEIGEETNDIKWEVDHRDKSDGGMLYECFNIRREIEQPNTSEDISSFVKEIKP